MPATGPATPRPWGKILAATAGGLSILACAGVFTAAGLGGAGWWWFSGDEPETVADADAPPVVVVVPPPPVVEPEDTGGVDDVPEVADNDGDDTPWWQRRPGWWPGGDAEPEPEDTDEPDAPPPVVVAPPEAPSFAASGSAFPARSPRGVDDTSTIEVILGDVAGSARSQSGLAETYWVQGTVADPDNGARRAAAGNRGFIDPAAIRAVGVKTAWTPIPGHTGVVAKCIPIHGEDTNSPAGCTRAAAVVAQR